MKKNLFTLLFLCLSISMMAQKKSITGTVVDPNNEPIISATVFENKTNNGTVTDLDGKFTLTVEENSVLTISYVGFQLQTVSTANKSTINVILIEDSKSLDEVVVVGYGTQKKSSLTASVSGVRSKDLERVQTTDVTSALQGKMAGVEILDGGSIPGGSFKIIIRGTATLSKNGSTEPLIIIDNAFANSTGLKAINPSDIASIEVLKDGAAAAIYGSRAANGVVLVTTKQGKKGTPKVSMDATYSFQNPTKTLDYLNANEWRTFSKQLVANSLLPGATTILTNALENENPTNPNRNTDWQKLWFKNNAPIYNANVRISGGGDSFTYNTSFGYYDQDGIITSTGFNKFTGRLNMTYKKGIITFSENLAIGHRKSSPQGTPQPSIALPTLPVVDEYDDYISGGREYYINGDVKTNPLASLHYDDSYKTNTDIIGGVNLGLNFFKGFDYRLGVSGTYTGIHEFSHSPIWYTAYLPNGEGDKQYGNNMNSLSEKRGEKSNYTIDNLLSYANSFGKHDIDLLLGTSWTKESTYTLAASSLNDMGAPNIIGVSSGKIDGKFQPLEYTSAMLSFFGRFNYIFDNRYLVSASLRRDESSKFPKKTRAGVFPSVSGAWNLHNEHFFPKQSYVSSVKFRGSWGQLGASFLDPYSFTSLAYGPVSYIMGSSNVRGNDGVVIYGANNALKWEVSTTWDVGLDMGLFDNKLNLTIDYYRKENTDLLVQLNNIPSSGTQLTINKGDVVPWSNAASVVNKGLEVSLNYRNMFANNFYLESSVNFSTMHNKVTQLGYNAPPIEGDAFFGGSSEKTTKTMIGHPIGSFWGYVVEQIDPETGYFIFQDNNSRDANNELTGVGEGRVTVDDKTIIGSPFPDFTYGLSLSMAWKGFDLSLDLQGVQGNDILSSFKHDNLFTYSSNVLKDVFNGWTPENRQASLPIMQEGRPQNDYISSFFIEDGSYLRGKNLVLGYSFPNRILQKVKISKLRVFASCQNFFTISQYSGYDPEVGYGEGIVERGVDKNAMPNVFTTSFGINVEF